MRRHKLKTEIAFTWCLQFHAFSCFSSNMFSFESGGGYFYLWHHPASGLRIAARFKWSRLRCLQLMPFRRMIPNNAFKYFRELVAPSSPRPPKVDDPLAKPQNSLIQVSLFGYRAGNVNCCDRNNNALDVNSHSAPWQNIRLRNYSMQELLFISYFYTSDMSTKEENSVCTLD